MFVVQIVDRPKEIDEWPEECEEDLLVLGVVPLTRHLGIGEYGHSNPDDCSKDSNNGCHNDKYFMKA